MLTQLTDKIDLIIFGETKLMKKFPTNIYNIPGYYTLVCCRSSKNAGGGLLIFIKRNIIIKVKWNLHYEHLEKKLSSTAGILWKLRHKLPTCL